MVSSLRRLAADHAALHDDLPPNYFFPSDDSDDLTQLTTFLAGPQGTPYSQGLWRLHLKMPDDYPKSPPKATFRTRIWHPNVEESTGAVCVDTLKRDWKATLTLKDVLITISCLLIYPNPDSALNSTAGALLQENYEAFSRQAKLMTSIHGAVPPEFKDAVKEAKSRGDDASAMFPEQEETPARSLRSRKGLPSQTVTMKRTRRNRRTVTPPLPSSRETHEPDAQQPDSHPWTPTADNGTSDDESASLSPASKENDPSLSPSPVKFAPPSPRKNALGKRPLSVLTMPLDPVDDDPFAMDAEDYDLPDGMMTASEKNIAANSSSTAAASSSSLFDEHNRHPDPDRSPQRKSPKLSVLNKGVNASGRIREDLKIFEDAPEITIDDLDRRRSGDGKENRHRAFGESKGGLSVSRSSHVSHAPSSLLAPPASTGPSSSKGAKPLAGTRKVSGSGGKTKPRVGIRRL